MFERDVVESDLDAALQRWAEEGWLATGSPVVVHQDASGRAVVRLRLTRTALARRPPSSRHGAASIQR